MPTIENGFEQGVAGATIAASGSGGGADTAWDSAMVNISGTGSAATYESSASAIQTKWGAFSSGTGTTPHAYVGWTTALGTVTGGVYSRFYMQLTNATRPEFRVQEYRSSGGTSRCRLNIGPNGELRVVNGSGTIVQTLADGNGNTVLIPINQKVRIESYFKFDSPYTYEVRYFSDFEVSAPAAVMSGTRDFGGSIAQARWGAVSDTASVPLFYLDAIGASTTTWFGPKAGYINNPPVVSPVATPTQLTRYVAPKGTSLAISAGATNPNPSGTITGISWAIASQPTGATLHPTLNGSTNNLEVLTFTHSGRYAVDISASGSEGKTTVKRIYIDVEPVEVAL